MAFLNHESLLVNILGTWKRQLHEKTLDITVTITVAIIIPANRCCAVVVCRALQRMLRRRRGIWPPCRCEPDPSTLQVASDAFTSRKQFLLPSHNSQIMYPLRLPFYSLPLLCRLFTTFSLVLWLFIYIVTQLSLCTLLGPLPG